MSIKKQYLNDYRTCKVTFKIPKKIGKNLKRAHVLGDFNNWSYSDTPMKKLKNGAFVAVVELPIGREYQFRYLLDDEFWMNDSDADRFVPVPFGECENCVLATYNDSHIRMIKANQLKPRSTMMIMGSV
ncbi:MAG: isoamylase early set domain-containing protein [Desulfobacterales bacterium]